MHFNQARAVPHPVDKSPSSLQSLATNDQKEDWEGTEKSSKLTEVSINGIALTDERQTTNSFNVTFLVQVKYCQVSSVINV